MKIKNSSIDESFNIKSRNINSYKIAVIGGGPAGIMAAISAAKILSDNNNKNKNKKTKSKAKNKTKNNKFYEVVLIEKNETLGKKLLLTGGGRCNITNNSDLKTHINAFGKNGSFLKHSLYNFDNKSILSFFKDKGLDFKVEAHGKVYPDDDKSSSVLKILEEYLQEYNVKLLLESRVSNIKRNAGYFEIAIEKNLKSKKSLNEFHNKINENKSFIKSSKVILATGGLSYPSTGSTGDGLGFAQNFGHKLTKLNPGLTPLKVQEEWIKELSGLKFENISLSFRNSSKKRVSYIGTILFTHFGLSGPGILDLSREISLITDSNINSQNLSGNKEKSEENKSVDKMEKYNFPVELFLDLIPDVPIDELKDKFNLEFPKKGKTIIKNYLKTDLPNKFIIPFLIHSNIDPNIQLSKISKKEKNRLINNLKDLKIHITGLMPFKSAMITCGGIYHKNMDSKTMESKLVSDMYFAGEIIEFCGLSGGYNLQMAFSTGYTAGKSSANSLI